MWRNFSFMSCHILNENDLEMWLKEQKRREESQFSWKKWAISGKDDREQLWRNLFIAWLLSFSTLEIIESGSCDSSSFAWIAAILNQSCRRKSLNKMKWSWKFGRQMSRSG